MGLVAIAEYFYEGLPACLTTLQRDLATAWTAEDGVKSPRLDPSGGSAAIIQERNERAARQLARGQEQLVVLLLTAIVTYLTRGQMKAGVMNSMESIATRSARLRAEMSNKEFANWLAKNEQKILAEPELQVKDVAPLKKVEPEQAIPPELAQPRVKSMAPPLMSLKDAVGSHTAEQWIRNERRIANEADPLKSRLLTDDQIGALHGYTLDEGYQWINPALRGFTPMTEQMTAFVEHATQGLSRLPPYLEADTYRGTTLPQHILDNIQMGHPTSDGAFFSTSAQSAKAFRGNVKFRVSGSSGRDISFLSGHPEAEVLYPPGTVFDVLNKIESGPTTLLRYKEIP